MKGKISISVLDDEGLLNVATDLFMEKYPDVEVTINPFRKADDMKDGTPSEAFSTENYLTQLNTKIMTGKAEDIILTDDLPLKKYTDMGAFEDLSFFLSHSPEVNEESHHMNVFELLKGKYGKLWEIPLLWTLQPIMYFDKALVEASNLSIEDGIQSMSYEDGLKFGKQLVDSTNLDNTFLEMRPSAL